MLMPMPELLAQARAKGYAIGYFEAWDSYSLEAVVEAAEAELSPVILGFGCMMVNQTWLDHGGIRSLGCLGRAMAERARVPVSFLLNEAHSYQEAIEAMGAGFNAVMLDTSACPWHEAVTQVSALVRVAHVKGVAVEAELGRLPDAVDGGIDRTAARLTDPELAATFVSETGVDCLAVSIGNVHLLVDGTAPVDMDLLEAIQDRVHLPLAMHGGSSFPSELVPEAVAHGAVKFNVGTALKKAFLDGIRDVIGGWPERVKIHDALGSHLDTDLMVAGKVRMCTKVREFMQVYGSNGQADDS